MSAKAVVQADQTGGVEGNGLTSLAQLLADVAGRHLRQCWQQPSSAAWETPAVLVSGSFLVCRKPGWGREV